MLVINCSAKGKNIYSMQIFLFFHYFSIFLLVFHKKRIANIEKDSKWIHTMDYDVKSNSNKIYYREFEHILSISLTRF